ncbi:sigma-70 family RNA polymerase sigma factor [Anatilimnocola floriformis]|uniref:sigma-70 family RNA polymerase sigma factor n=1 Tax=Anatilimnocola floriformis TaxID=2948575 RepID=UPI0020C53BAB|nr:sigma-70 family RNA polymerase sigma factor [Anatilimnocola floriformis]
MSSQDNEESFGNDSVLVHLLQQASTGDKPALEQLFQRLYPYMLLCARNELDSDLRAQVRESDLVQQSLLEAHQDFPKFEGRDVHTLIKWIETILKSNVADLRRRYDARKRQGVEPAVSLDDSQSSFAQQVKQNLFDSGPGEVGASSTADSALEQALARLTEDHREVILLRHRDKLSFAEIGERTNRSADAARMCWTRAVKRLQSELTGEPDE